MTSEDFEYLSGEIKGQSGLVLTADKAYLLESRLMPIARRYGMRGLEEMIATLRKGSEATLLKDVMEAMTTNESFFFRDVKPFELLRNEILPELIKKRATKKSFRIWCAAASSGQEPYSLAMIMKEEAVKFIGWKHEIIGTDISTEILAKARSGVYSQFEVQRGLPIQQLVKHFKKKDDMWQIDDSIRDMVKYKEFNLLEDLSPLGSFDIVFCRNVLIYFDQETKGKILEGISRLIPPDGLLFLGGAETVLGISKRFKPVKGQRGVYCLSEAEESPRNPVVGAPVTAAVS